MANEKEKRQTELTANRFANEEKRRKVHAVEKHLEEVRRGVSFLCSSMFLLRVCCSQRKETENLLRRIKNDIHADFGDLRDPKRLKTVVSNLNEKFILNEEVRRFFFSLCFHRKASFWFQLRNIHAGEPEAQGISEERFREDRQRKYLELSMNDLKHRLSNDLHATKANRMRILNVKTRRKKKNLEISVFCFRQRKIRCCFENWTPFVKNWKSFAADCSTTKSRKRRRKRALWTASTRWFKLYIPTPVEKKRNVLFVSSKKSRLLLVFRKLSRSSTNERIDQGIGEKSTRNSASEKIARRARARRRFEKSFNFGCQRSIRKRFDH